MIQYCVISCISAPAVSYEYVETIAALPPHAALLEQAAKGVERFLTAKNINYKYLG